MTARRTVFEAEELPYCQDEMVRSEQKIFREEFWVVGITKFVEPFDALSGRPERFAHQL